jgi:hypothetical protein
MFVSDTEREGPGGVFTFLLPMCLFGAGAGFAMSQAGSMVDEVGTALPEVLWGVFGVACIVLLFIWRAQRPVTAGVAALVVGGLFVLMQSVATDTVSQGWLPVGVFFASLVLARALTDQRSLAWPAFPDVFPPIVTLPIILLLATLALGFFLFILYTVVELLGQNLTEVLSGQSGSLPVAAAITGFGALGGAVFAFIRYQRVLVGAVRYAVLWLARLLLPAMAVIGVMLLLSRLMEYGAALSYDDPVTAYRVGGLMLLAVMLVYQDGLLAPPALWLRVSAIFCIILGTVLLLPALLAQTSLGGLKPDQLLGVGLAIAYGSFAFIGLVSGLVTRAGRWMPLLAPLSVVWLVALAAMPLVLWGVSVF